MPHEGLFQNDYTDHKGKPRTDKIDSRDGCIFHNNSSHGDKVCDDLATRPSKVWDDIWISHCYQASTDTWEY